jgi:hypothetical protein
MQKQKEIVFPSIVETEQAKEAYYKLWKNADALRNAVPVIDFEKTLARARAYVNELQRTIEFNHEIGHVKIHGTFTRNQIFETPELPFVISNAKLLEWVKTIFQ